MVMNLDWDDYVENGFKQVSNFPLTRVGCKPVLREHTDCLILKRHGNAQETRCFTLEQQSQQGGRGSGGTSARVG